MMLAAEQMSMTFHPKDEEKHFVARMNQFELGQRGHSQKASNVMIGTANDEEVTLMDFYFQVGHGKNAQRNLQSVAIFEYAGWNMPTFMLRPEHFGDRIKSSFGKDDIDFDDSPIFSKKYFLQGPDEEAIRGFFTPQLRSFFAERQGWYVEANDYRLLICRKGRQKKPSNMIEFLRECLLIKEQVVVNED